GDGIRDFHVTGVQTCALPILPSFAAAVAAVRAALRDGAVTLVCIGGLSNAARLLDALDADERRRLEIVAMGGSFERDYTGAPGRSEERRVGTGRRAARQADGL